MGITSVSGGSLKGWVRSRPFTPLLVSRTTPGDITQGFHCVTKGRAPLISGCEIVHVCWVFGLTHKLHQWRLKGGLFVEMV